MGDFGGGGGSGSCSSSVRDSAVAAIIDTGKTRNEALEEAARELESQPVEKDVIYMVAWAAMIVRELKSN